MPLDETTSAKVLADPGILLTAPASSSKYGCEIVTHRDSGEEDENPLDRGCFPDFYLKKNHWVFSVTIPVS
jgi:hypothetical protein